MSLARALWAANADVAGRILAHGFVRGLGDGHLPVRSFKGYVAQDALEWSTNSPVITKLSASAEHLSDDAPFDVYLVAPATAASIGRMAHGIAEGAVGATLACAIGRMEQGRAKVLVAPTMHGTMHNSILIKALGELNDIGVRIIPPRDAYGKHNLPDESTLVSEVCNAVSALRLRRG